MIYNHEILVLSLMNVGSIAKLQQETMEWLKSTQRNLSGVMC